MSTKYTLGEDVHVFLDYDAVGLFVEKWGSNEVIRLGEKEILAVLNNAELIRRHIDTWRRWEKEGVPHGR